MSKAGKRRSSFGIPHGFSGVQQEKSLKFWTVGDWNLNWALKTPDPNHNGSMTDPYVWFT